MAGSIYKRGNSYTVSFSNGYDQNGKRQRYTKSGFKTKKEAKKYLFELNQKYYNGELCFNDKMVLSDFLDYWFQNDVEPNHAKNTISGYRTNIEKHIKPAIGHLIVSKIKPVHIQEFYLQLSEKGLSATSITYIHRNLHTAFKYGKKMQMFSNDVFDLVKPPRIEKYKVVTLTSEQSAILIKSVENTEIYLPVVLAVTLGLRRGEVLGLQWQDFKQDLKLLSIERNANRVKGGMEFAPLKTNSSRRTLLLNDELVNILLKEKERQNEYKEIFGYGYNPNDLICCRLTGDFITTNFLDKHFKSALIENNLPVIRFHDLRHTNATILYENNVPDKIVSSRLGHSSTKTTNDIYGHLTHKMQENCVDVLNNSFFN